MTCEMICESCGGGIEDTDERAHIEQDGMLSPYRSSEIDMSVAVTHAKCAEEHVERLKKQGWRGLFWY